MNADSIKIECEEDGFHLIIDGDSPCEGYTASTVDYRITDPEALYDHVRAAIEPWLQERNAAKAEYDRAQRQSDTRNLSDEEFSAYLDDAYGDNWAKRVGMEQMRESGHA
jgi:hypothetical protein